MPKLLLLLEQLWDRYVKTQPKPQKVVVKNGGLPDKPKTKTTGKILAGGQRKKGERLDDYNERAHRGYKDAAVEEKKRTGNWLPKEKYEKLTGKTGRKD